MAGNWLLRGGDTSTPAAEVIIVNLKDGASSTVLIRNVIGDRVRVHVLDDANDSLLGPGESVVRRGTKVFVSKINPTDTAYGTFDISGTG